MADGFGAFTRRGEFNIGAVTNFTWFASPLMIRHTVFFSAKDKADVDRIFDGLSMLAKIPHVDHFEVARNLNRDTLSETVDVVVYAEFKNEEALAAYKAHEIYQSCIDIVRPLRELRIAADFPASL